MFTGTIIFSRTNILKGFIIVHTLSPDDAGANDGSLDVKIMRRNCSDHGGSSRWLDLGLLFQVVVVVVVVVFLLLGPGGGAEPPKAADPSLDDTVPSGGEGDARTRTIRRSSSPPSPRRE